MIVLQLIGGLGNQMFQYAAGLKMATDRGTELVIDTSEFESYALRRHELSSFAVTARMATETDLKRFKVTIIEVLLDKLKLLGKASVRKAINSSGEHDLLIRRDDYGHWNNPRHFTGVEDVLREEFTLRGSPNATYNAMIHKIQKSVSVSVHIRRGDYLAAKNRLVFAECSKEYFSAAIDLMARKIGAIECFVFSDDVNWVRENLTFNHPATYVSGNEFTDAEEIMLMAACKHNITANSTFSW